ncbi:cytochrome c oxidase subunit I [Candidatus Methylacidiphilum fumarolicum]|uniref:Heme/copper-type cytochrome oxidase, subunit 1 n=2 Tax=Candidatus Methylacidiphilum fumarolicum TaxID=591154 RepID=I0JY85_METFB|nr:cbb3-type cytochrome c oxidase subunit I [Candidatus Methylacidiphilum fumarolicum]MBW6416013.1 cbb3-type cytochrome c oxidase subunit I [Candidatus Methylacidiphilum fumarolicum]TFE66918.1 cytochrome c oxidase subunit I [Candidatus Methylacidiphilum fumarolicum]TFE71479.1 cytochrome c oxidase subunit I [Candidatus Methylacidiphilum fumarolicum]TFE72001.1 cytochrome c oxidase subunit I [Candidatus Methylacidiphilum fumarolicum]TFE75065.1 cytochrome c oxidase subunit I [Candidatus Methylacid
MKTTLIINSSVVQNPLSFEFCETDRKLILGMILVGFGSLALGVFLGLLQAFNYAGVGLYQFLPGLKSYYHGLTLHGVLNGFVFPFAASNGFLSLTTIRSLGLRMPSSLLLFSLLSLFLGTALSIYGILFGNSAVLYTFYVPMRAHWSFYLGIAFLVVSTWAISLAQLITLRKWKKNHPTDRIPLLAYASILTYIMWDISSIGATVEDLFFLLPWSLNLLPGSDATLTRTLFWFTGHPIVYFWLLPVYVSWYFCLPAQVGGKVFSDQMVRSVFVAFLILVPVGFHHQYSDPGIGLFYKWAAAVLTFGIAFPSLVTAFSVVYSLEIGGLSRGGKGIFGWVKRLPWKDPSVCAQILAGIAFLPGGMTGIMHASVNMDLLLHNTSFLPGHFHLTVGAAVALSLVGIAYWLVPYLLRKKLWGSSIARWQPWIYFVGVLVFSSGQMSGGVLGMPRRTALALIPYEPLPGWKIAGILTAVGGSLMFLSFLIFFLVMVMTIFFGQKEREPVDIPLGQVIHGPSLNGPQLIFDKISYWVLLCFALIAFLYGPFLITHLPPKFICLPFQGF